MIKLILSIITLQLYFVGYVGLYSTCASNNSSDKGVIKKNNNNYKVYKIDSLNNFYLIYAIKNGSNYKIISQKDKEVKCKNIHVKGEYDFVLHDTKDVTLNNDTTSTKFYLFNVSCLIYNDTTKICIEKGENFIATLFYATNIKSLCYIPDVLSVR